MTALHDKAAIAAAFSRAAAQYDQAARFQRLSGEKLMALAPPAAAGSKVLDAGCGTGYFSHAWRMRGHCVTALDLAPGMLDKARENGCADRYLQGDIEHLPLEDASVDLCFSNLAVQWCTSLKAALKEMHRVTRPGGKILFSTLAEHSLRELREAWSQVDDRPHVNHFLSAEAIADACRPYPHWLCQHTETELFSSVPGVLHSLKGIGATHLHQGRHPGLSGRQRMAHLQAVYPQRQGKYPLSYQLILGVIERE